MNNTYVNKHTRILYYFLSIFIVLFSIFKLSTSPITLYTEDYIFLIILMLSFVLVNKYSLKFKVTNINFSDFIIIICYIKFSLYITALMVFICYFISFAIEYNNSKNLNLLTENTHVFNRSLVILSVFISHIIINKIDNIYYLRNYEQASVILFSVFILMSNYILYCLNLSFEYKALIFITLENGLYYILLNFITCTILACFSIYLYNSYGYMPIVFMTAFIIFISFSLNSLDKLKITNKNLKNITENTNFLISRADFKVKLQHTIQTIETMIPFVYCGIYIPRENYTSIYPLTYKCNTLVSMEDLKFSTTSDNHIYNQLMSGVTLYKESSYFKKSINLTDTLSKEIKYTASIPIKDCDHTIGFFLLCIDRYLNLDEEIELINILGRHMGMVNFHINTNIKNNFSPYKTYDGLIKCIDYNIKHKVFFTLAVIELTNYTEIIQKYNLDFYEAFKNELSRIISKLLSPSDNLLCFEKEDIYIVFNLLDIKNASNKLDEISAFLSNFKYKDIPLNIKISYACSEYPVEGISADEILDNTYRKLHLNKSVS